MQDVIKTGKVKKFGYELDYRLKKVGTELMHQWHISFKNGYGASIIGGAIAYGDGIDSFEVAVLKNDVLCYATPITNDVLPYLTEDQVAETLKKIEALKGD